MLYKNFTYKGDAESKTKTQDIMMIFFNNAEAKYIEKYYEQAGFDNQTKETDYQTKRRGYDNYIAISIKMLIFNFFDEVIKLKDKLQLDLPFLQTKRNDELATALQISRNGVKYTCGNIKNHYECLILYYYSDAERQRIIKALTVIKDKLDELGIESHGFNEMIDNIDHNYYPTSPFASCPSGFSFGPHVANAFIELMALSITLNGYQFKEVIDTSLQRPQYDEDGNRTDLPVKLREEEKEIIKDAEKYSAELAERIQKAFERRNEDD